MCDLSRRTQQVETPRVSEFEQYVAERMHWSQRLLELRHADKVRAHMRLEPDPVEGCRSEERALHRTSWSRKSDVVGRDDFPCSGRVRNVDLNNAAIHHLCHNMALDRHWWTVCIDKLNGGVCEQTQ